MSIIHTSIFTVSPEYFCHLDGNLRRTDQLQRPELSRGTVDFVVPSEYWASNPPPRLSVPYFSVEPPPEGARAPQPMNFLFALDVSSESLRSGMLHTVCVALQDALFGTNACFPPESGFAILTFDDTLHFYDLSVCPSFRLFVLANKMPDRASQISSLCSLYRISTRCLSRYAVGFL